MKQLFTFFLLLCTVQIFAAPKPFAAPTTAPTNFTATTTDGDRINLSWTSGNGGKRIVIARKDAATTFIPANGVNYGGSLVFGAGNEVAPGEFVVYNGSANSATVSGLQASTNYHFAVFEYNGTGAGIEFLTTPAIANGSTVSAPSVQVTNITVTNINGNSLKLNWTEPPVASGSTGRLILAREGSPVNVNPVDLFNHTSNAQFGLGTEIGSGNFVLAETNAASLNVISLKPNTTYHFAFFEYRGNNGLVYNIVTPPAVSATTLPRPTVASSAPLFSLVEGSSMRLAFTKGNGARRIVVARAGAAVSGTPVDGTTYTANAAFGTAGTGFATGEFVVAAGNVDNVTVTGLTKATTYHFAVFEYDGTGAGTAYLSATPMQASQATVSAPTIQTSGLNVTSVTNNAVTFSWTAGNGARRLVLMRKDAPVNAVPVDLTPYGQSTNFGSGSQIGTGNYVVYDNSGTNSTTVSGLTAGATYHFSAFEYNGSSAPVYLTANPPAQQFTTGQSPTQAPTSFQWSNVDGNRLTLNWSGGNGAARIVVLKAGSGVTGVPVNGTTYTASNNFGSGNQLASGEYVMMNGNNSQLTFLNLQPGVTYHAAIFEYNVVNGQPSYLTTPGVTNQSTAAVPTAQATNLQFSNVTGNSMKITWAGGNGARRLVVVRAGNPVNATPAAFVYYHPNPLFGSGGDLGGGNYSVFSDNTNTVTLSNLSTSTIYHVAVYEYNGISYPAYLTTAPLTGSHQTADRPSVPSSNFSLVGIDGNRMTVRWLKGNGTKRLVVASATGPVTALPQDGTEYTGNETFGSGAALLPGQFALQSSNEAEVIVQGLLPGTTYQYAVFEYDGTGSTTRYLTTAYGTINGTTLSAPASGPANVLFASIGTTTSTINWTNAVADRHLVVVRKASPVSVLPQQLKPYQASAFYGHSATVMAPEHYVVFNASGSIVNVTGLQSGVTYHVSVFAFNGNLGPVYNTANVATSSFTTLGPPTDAASNITTTPAGTASATIRWANGSGQKRLVLMRAGGAPTAQPSDATIYTANSFFGSGQDLGNNTYAMYAGAADFVTVSNLQKDKVYYIAVYEYNQFTSGPMYLTTTFAQGQFNGVILPIKLSSFSGSKKAGANELQWTTEQEANSAEFVVERSGDGTNFTAIGRVAASGNSSTTKRYSFEDRSPSALAFYRLKLVDVNGSAAYSNVIRLEAGAKEESLLVYPSIASSRLQLSLHTKQKAEGLIQVIDMSGRIVMQQKQSFAEGSSTTIVDVSGLTAGQYIVQLQYGQSRLTQRFIKQ